MDDEITIYDVTTDEQRPVTQSDVDRLTLAALIMSRSRRAAKCLEQTMHKALVGDVSTERFFAVLDQIEKSCG